MTTRAEIVAHARDTLGTSYAEMDCAGVPLYVARKLGMDVKRFPVRPSADTIRDYLDSVLVRGAKADMQPGDIVWLRFKVQPTHFGVVGDYLFGGLSLIHSNDDKSIAKVVEHRLDDAWKSRIVAVWRYPGVA